MSIPMPGGCKKPIGFLVAAVAVLMAAPPAQAWSDVDSHNLPALNPAQWGGLDNNGATGLVWSDYTNLVAGDPGVSTVFPYTGSPLACSSIGGQPLCEVGPFTMGFTTTFYGMSYDRVAVSPFGYVRPMTASFPSTFHPNAPYPGGMPYSVSPSFTSPTFGVYPYGVIGGLWTYWCPPPTRGNPFIYWMTCPMTDTNSKILAANIPGPPGDSTFVIQFQKVYPYYTNGIASNFEIRIYQKDSHVEVRFRNINIGYYDGTWTYGNPYITGIENGCAAGIGAGCLASVLPNRGVQDPGPSALTYSNPASCFNFFIGSCLKSWTNKIVLYYPTPTVDFKASPLNVCQNTPATFTDLSMSSIGPPLTILWDFGEIPIQTSAIANPTHTYTKGPADYTVSLTETYKYGFKATTTKTVHVNGCIAPVCQFDSLVAADGVLLVSDKSYDKDGLVQKWSWDWGDKSPTYVGMKPVQHVYEWGGNYDVTLTVTDNEGTPTSCKHTVHIPGEAPDIANFPVAVAEGPATVTDGDHIRLDGSGGDAYRAVTFTWTQVAGPSVTLTSANTARPGFDPVPLLDREPQVYGFTLQIYDGKFTSKPDPVLITVMPPAITPQADAGADQQVLQGSQVSLDASHSSAPDGSLLTYQWTQVSGPTVGLSDAHSVAPTFTAPKDGSPQATTLLFEVVASSPASDSSPDSVAVTVNPLQAGGADAIVYRKAYDVQEGLVDFEAQVPGGDAMTFEWDFGDGTAAREGQSVSHVFSDTKTYTVTLRALGDGAPQVFQKDVPVYVAPTGSAVSAAAPAKSSPAPGPMLAIGLLGLAAVALSRRR